jgi:uncharacterized protein YydD (DUF2326 family)
MRLIQLTSSQPSFKTVRFNPTGLSLVVGRHTHKQAKNIQATYNGVGKSLLIALVHYCLGSSRNKHFDTHLQGWDFTLAFEHDGQTHQVTRTVGEDMLLFDTREMRLPGYKETLNELGVFEIPADTPGLTFRALINFFVRPARGSYNAPEAAVVQWTPYYRVLYQSVLLGLDYLRAIQKHDAKKKLDDQLELANRYKKDKELREFYLGEKNAEVELASLKERIAKLQENLAAFTVAEDYTDRQAAADELHAKILEARNEEAILDARIADIELGLTLRPDVPPDRVVQLYEEAKVSLPSLVKKRLDDADRFFDRLRENRRRRLEQEKKLALEQRKEWQEKRSKWQTELDGLFHYLKAHRALEEYTENNRYLSELTARARKIEDYLSLLAKYTDEAQRIRAEMGKATVQTTEYLKAAKPHLDLLMDGFRAFAQEFYGDKPAGLVIRNNDRDDNQVRYDIEARIEHDAADGINHVRIFCFDLLLLVLRQRHRVDFLVHDSRLYSDMDWHQRLTLFRLADRIGRERGLQYIAAINEDHVESVREAAGPDFDRLFIEPRVVELTDEPDGSGKLLGIQIEMKYEED